MKRYPFLLSVLSLFCILHVGIFASDPLWNKAMDYAAPENVEEATGMRMLSREMNRSSEVTKKIEMFFTWDENLQDFILLSADEDGKDVTDRERQRNEKQNRNRRGNYVHQIFNPEKADRLTLSHRELTAVVNGRECRIYDFRLEDEWPMGPGKPKPVVEEGMVLIDLESGMPLRISSSMVEGPDAVKSFQFSLYGGPGPEGLWRVFRIKMDFIAQMIIYRAGVFTMDFEYED